MHILFIWEVWLELCYERFWLEERLEFNMEWVWKVAAKGILPQGIPSLVKFWGAQEEAQSSFYRENKSQWAQTETQEVLAETGNASLLWEWLSTSNYYQEKFWSFYPWRYSKVVWTLSQGMCSSCPCMSRNVEPGDLQKSLPTSTLWFCDSVGVGLKRSSQDKVRNKKLFFFFQGMFNCLKNSKPTDQPCVSF